MLSYDFFKNGYSQIDSIEDFMSSTAALFYKCIHGDLSFSNGKGFINVHRMANGQMYASQAFFMDKLGYSTIIGHIAPKAFLDINKRLVPSSVAVQLSTNGYAKIPIRSSKSINQLISQRDFTGIDNIEMVLRDISPSERGHTATNTNRMGQAELMTVDKVILKHESDLVERLLKEHLPDNPMISRMRVKGVRIHKMTPDTSPLHRHFDSSMYCQEMLFFVRWVIPSGFTGRQLLLERYLPLNEDDLYAYALNMLQFKTEELDVGGSFILDATIDPEGSFGILFSGVNPLFVHSVTKMLSGEGVYAVVTNIGLGD